MLPASAHDRSHPLARIARQMAILNGLAAVVLVPAGLLGVWLGVYAVVDGNVDGVGGHVLSLGASAGLLVVMGIGAWLLAGYIAVARGRARGRVLWQASLAFNAAGVALAVVLAFVEKGGTVFALASLVWPAAMAGVSVQALRLTDELATGAMPTGEPLA